MERWSHGKIISTAGSDRRPEARGRDMTWIDDREAQEPEKIRAALANYAERRSTLRVAEHDGGDDRFGLWLALVDARITRRVGLGLFDLGDWNIRDAYDSGSSPADAAQEALESDDTYAAMFE
jgi:hypothetical protein